MLRIEIIGIFMHLPESNVNVGVEYEYVFMFRHCVVFNKPGPSCSKHC